jgi:hypothetical protein
MEFGSSSFCPMKKIIIYSLLTALAILVAVSVAMSQDYPRNNNNGPPPAKIDYSKTGIYFPLFAPPGPLWDNVLAYRNAHPFLPWIAVVDPYHGPGQQFDANYARNIEKLQSSHVVVLGYVSTRWGERPPDLIKDDIKRYKEWYRTDGIMLDEMVSNPGFEGHYSGLTRYAKSLGLSPVIGNVGTNISPSYVGTVDSIGTAEGDGVPPLSWLKGWHLDYSKGNFVYITYSQSWIDPEYVAESSKYVRLLYITDDTMPFPYDSFPSYFDEVVSALDPGGQNNLRNLSVKAHDLLGNALNGTLATVTSGKDTLASGPMPLTYVGSKGLTYTVTAQGNQTYAFDHWDDGSTNPSRTVTLDSSKVLRAYYKAPSVAGSMSQSHVIVNALTLEGGQLRMGTAVNNQDGSLAKSGLTPLIFAGQSGASYTVTASNYQNLVFDHWDDGSTNSTRKIDIPENNNAYLTAYYRTAKDPSLASLTVDAYTLDGTEIRGLWSVIAPSNGTAVGGFTPFTRTVEPGKYIVTTQDSGVYVFDHWKDTGSANRTRTIMPGQDTTVTAYYRTPPATLKVNSAPASGDIPVPGMRVTVTTINNSTVRAGLTNMTFVGNTAGVYAVTASDGQTYAFDHWDDGSTDRTKRMMLASSNPGAEVTAYYRSGNSMER